MFDPDATGDDSLDGGAGDDTALFLLAAGPGVLTYVTVGDDLIVKRDGADIAQISFSPGSATVTGLGAAAHLGTDTISNIEHLKFAIDGGGDELVIDLADGAVVDGYISGATVFIDLNDNGVLDMGEPSTTTDANGNFTLPGGGGPLIMFGGTDIATGLPNQLEMRAPEGSAVVTPLTTLIQLLVEGGATPEDAQDAIADAFGIDPDVDLSTFDPFADPGDPNALSVQQAAATVAVLVQVGGEAIGGGDGNEADVFDALADLIDAAGGGAVDLTDPAVATFVLEDASGGSSPEIDAAASSIAETAEVIDNSTSLDQVSAAQAEGVYGPSPYYPDEDDVGVNTTTANAQTDAAVTYLNDGKFVVTWTSDDAGVVDGEIRGQMFNADGTPFNTEFVVNSVGAGNQAESAVTALASGGFVVTWASGNDIAFQRYDADGVTVGLETPVTVSPSTTQSAPAIAGFPAGAGGGFVIVWTDDSTGNTEVQAQRYDSTGLPAGGVISVNAPGGIADEQVGVTVLSNGDFVVVWKDGTSDPEAPEIMGRIFSAAGVPAGAEFQINSTTLSTQEFPAITALTGGGFAVAWTNYSISSDDSSGSSIRARIFDALGAPAGLDFVVNSHITFDQRNAAIAARPDGGFVVTWTDEGGDGLDVRGQAFDASGAPIGSEFLVNSTSAGDQSLPAINIDSLGNVVVAWTDTSGALGDNDSSGIAMRLFDGDDAPVVDDFSGNSATFTEGDAYALLDDLADGAALVSDVDSADFAGGTLSFGIPLGVLLEDSIIVTATGLISVSGSDVVYNGTTVIGTIAAPAPGELLHIDFNADATPARVQELLRAIAYANTAGNDPDAGTRSIAYILTDGDGGSTGGGVNVDVVAVNDVQLYDASDVLVGTFSTI